MAAKREIKTTIVLDGEKEFKEAIKVSKQELSVMGSELKNAASEFKLTGDQMTYLGRKSEILTREIKEQEEVIRRTAEMYEKAANGGDEYAGKARQLNIQLNNSQATLNRMKKELQDADRELEELGRDSITAGRDIERGLTNAADDATRELKQLQQTLDKQSRETGKIGNVLTGGLVIDMAEATVDFIKGVDEWATASLEYSTAVAKLKTVAELSEIDWNAVEAEFIRVAGLTETAEEAITGVSALINAGYNDANTLNSMATLLLGATIKLQNLSFEGLATSLQETINKKEAVGEIEELITAVGGNVEEFNKDLASLETNAAVLQFLLAYLANHGLKNAHDQYVLLNGDITAAKSAQALLNHQWQRLGTNIATWLAPAKTNFAELLSTINSLIEGEKTLNEIMFGGKVPEPAPVGELVEKSAEGIEKALDGELQTPFALYKIWQGKEAEPIQIDVPVEPQLVPATSPDNTTPEDQAAQMLQQAMQAMGLDSTEITIPVITTGEDALDTLSDDLTDYETDAYSKGAAIGRKLASGINGGLQAGLASINRSLSLSDRLMGYVNTPTQQTTTASAQPATTQVNLSIDGKTFARVVTPYIDQQQGKTWRAAINT